MRIFLPALLLASLPLAAQQSRPADATANLPAQSIGPNDLIAVSVYDSPEFSRTVRVGADGLIRLPMLPGTIKAQGLYPSQLEKTIAQALKDAQLLVDPFVTVTIAE